MNRRKLVMAAAGVALTITVAGAGVTGAYLTDRTPQRNNVVTLGHVGIVLSEQGWIEGEPQLLNPEGALKKEPIVTNTGNSEAWVRLRVALDSNTLTLLRRGELTIGGVNTEAFGWDKTPDSLKNLSSEAAARGIEIVATYKSKLPPGGVTPPIFKTLTLGSGYTEREPGESLTLTVTAEAVQTIPGKTAVQCFAALNN